MAQLVEVQKTLDTDAGYNALNKQCDELKSKSPPYALPKKMEYWAPVDVFFFLSQEKFALTLGMFIRPLANSSIGGKELLEMCNATEMVSLLLDRSFLGINVCTNFYFCFVL